LESDISNQENQLAKLEKDKIKIEGQIKNYKNLEIKNSEDFNIILTE